MKLFEFVYKSEWGRDYNYIFLKTKNYSFVQLSVFWGDGIQWPYIQITSGSGKLLGILFWVGKFSFDIDILGRTWNLNRDDVE
jgi:hypothetical protein